MFTFVVYSITHILLCISIYWGIKYFCNIDDCNTITCNNTCSTNKVQKESLKDYGLTAYDFLDIPTVQILFKADHACVLYYAEN